MKSNAQLAPTDLPDGASLNVAVGDLVRTSQNRHPHYRVIAVMGDRAWIRDTQYGSDHVVPIDRCRPIEDNVP